MTDTRERGVASVVANMGKDETGQDIPEDMTVLQVHRKL